MDLISFDNPAEFQMFKEVMKQGEELKAFKQLERAELHASEK